MAKKMINGRPAMTTRRKMTIATWKPSKAGVIHGTMTLEATAALRYLEDLRERTGERVTLTALVGAAVGRALAAEPTLNGRIAFGRYIPFDHVVVSFLVQMDEGSDLAQVRVEDADRKTVVEVSRDLHARAAKLRSGQDEAYEKSKTMMKIMPTWALRRVLSFSGFVTSGLGKSAFGQPAFPFGAAIITSVGMLGIDEAFVPPTPFARVPIYVAVGAVRDMVFVEDNAPVVRPGVTLTCTLDHRFVDGFQAGGLAREMRRSFTDPASLGPVPEQGPIASEVTESPAT